MGQYFLLLRTTKLKLLLKSLNYLVTEMKGFYYYHSGTQRKYVVNDFFLIKMIIGNDKGVAIIVFIVDSLLVIRRKYGEMMLE